MARKSINRKKLLKKQAADARRANRLLHTPLPVLTPATEQVQSTESRILSLEEFTTLPALADLSRGRLETFYQAGIRSLADFTDYTETDLLALKGIGPATIKQLREAGLVLKEG